MLDLLENLSKSLDEVYNATGVIDTLRDFFSKNFNICKFSIYIFDAEENRLNDLSKEFNNTDLSDSDNSVNEKLEIFQKIKNKYLINNQNLYYVIQKQGKNIGLLEFENFKDNSILDFLNIASFIISLKIQNIILAETMQKNIDFHELIRNIAKIIETQYDLNYIIPLIGEMIDKFLTNHLTYIFIQNNNKFELLWPSKCNDENIIKNLEIITEKDKSLITANRKTGLFPLVNENRILGCIVTKSMGADITENDINYLEQIAKQSSATINRANVYAEILKHATLDALTGFYNRRQLEERIKQETAKAKRQKTPLCAIMIDIDFFKRINDQYGHTAGDLVLKTVSKTMRSQLREYDIAGRYGGEEFAILLPFTKTDEAVMVAERLRQAVENKIIDLSKVNQEIANKNINATISLGIYQFKTTDAPQDLLKKADEALYQAKETGRNKVVIKADE